MLSIIFHEISYLIQPNFIMRLHGTGPVTGKDVIYTHYTDKKKLL